MNDKLHILLADDDDIFTMLVQRALSSIPELAANHRLTCVSDGADAVDYLRRQPPYEDPESSPRPHLVLLDQRMSRMDGTEALAEIKSDESLADLPVCILSTSDDDRLKATCYSHGASFFIKKPLQYEHLRGRLHLMVRFIQEVLEVA